MKRLIFTVTNDLSYDQRMIRICSSLSTNGYDVCLVGRKFSGSADLKKQPFRQKRISCIFNRGFTGYAEYNIRLLYFLLLMPHYLICAVDLDTILTCLISSRLKRTKRVYDAHELFCEMKEIATRPVIYRLWKIIEKHTVPSFKKGYTVNQPIAAEFRKMYGVDYAVIRNTPILRELNNYEKSNRYIIYQGAVNEGRCFETLIPAMKDIAIPLVICGDGNFMEQAQHQVRAQGLQHKVLFKGMVAPEELKTITEKAWLGITLFDKEGASNYYSLANRFFDYMHVGIPQVCVDYPVYREINNEFEFAYLIPDTDSASIARAVNELLTNSGLYNKLQEKCFAARATLNWQQEETKLLSFYQNL